MNLNAMYIVHVQTKANGLVQPDKLILNTYYIIQLLYILQTQKI